MSIALQREQSHAEVYLVVGGWKLWITSPTEMSALGFDWSQVQVVPDGTLAHVPSTPLGPYSIGKASDVMFDNVVFIGLIPHVKPENNCKPPEAIIKRDILVAGWLRVAAERNRDPEGYGTEDYHYDVILDVDFMMQMYGPGGLSTALNGAVLPSHFPNDDDPSPGPPLRFDDVSEFDHTTSRGITMNSFALPNTGERSGHDPDQAKPLFSQAGVLGTDPRGPEPVGYAETNRDYFQTGPVCVFGELNTWHINYEGPWPPWFHVHGYFEGRGTPPAGWVGDPGPSPLPTNWVSDANERYPFNPHNPDDGPRDLQIGDYVIMRGTLWQEHAHDPAPPHSLWRAIPGLQGHAGKLEMHPVDWLKRVDPPAVAKTAYTVACSGEEPPQAGPASRGFSVTFFPYPKQAPWSPATLKCTEIIDGRFTDMTTLYSHSATVTNTNQVVVQVERTSNSLEKMDRRFVHDESRLRAAYL